MLLTNSGITIEVNNPGEIARFKGMGYTEVVEKAEKAGEE